MILALDVGKTTGYCLTYDDGDIYALGNVPYCNIMSSELARWSSDRKLARFRWDVVIEYPVESIISSTKELRVAIDTIRKLFPDAIIVRPGEWKNSAAVNQPLPDSIADRKLTQHEKDAIGIARWYRELYAP